MRVTSRRNSPWWRLARSFNGLFGGSLILLAILFAAGAPVLAPRGYQEQDLMKRMLPPAWMERGEAVHPLGTDPLGRDLWNRLVWAAQVSIGIATTSVVLALAFGVLAGLIAGYYGGIADVVLMRVADVQLAFPYLLLAIGVMTLLEPRVINLVVVLALPGWVVYARTVRSSVLSLKRREFVDAAVALGASHWRVLFTHIAPNVLTPIIVLSSFQLAQIIIAEASLSFLGVGIQPPTPSWGAMLNQGREYMTSAWWMAVFPGLAIVLSVLGVNLLGDGLRDALDPRLKL